MYINIYMNIYIYIIYIYIYMDSKISGDNYNILKAY